MAVETKPRRRAKETPSMFVMRSFTLLADEMDEREIIAMIGWLNSKSAAILKERQDSSSTETGKQE